VSEADRNIHAQIVTIRWRAALERERAEQCDVLAGRHEMQGATAAASVGALHARLAGRYHSAQLRHLMAAELHELLAERTEARRDRATGGRPALMAAVANVLGTQSALVMLGGRVRDAATVAVSDRTAQASHDLELVMAEGPVTDAAKGLAVVAAGSALLDRWPRYGPAVAELGIRAVEAAPLRIAGANLGAVCVLDQTAESREGAAVAVSLMAEALTRILLANSDIAGPDLELAALAMLGESDSQDVVHQAIGMISVQFSCGINDAADLLAVRAFADGKPVREIAEQVVHGDSLFTVG
jgi:hypothetical protein